jgi:hypothetical protein
MKQRSLFIFCLILVSAAAAASQTVTNADLEKYREQRLSAERDYQENYARLGFPSPEELDRRREESIKQTEELSAKLRAERLERERVDAYRELETMRAAQYNRQLLAEQPTYSFGDYPGYLTYGGYGGFGYGGIRRRHRVRHHGQAGYYGGGQFWPTGTVRPRSAPMLIQKRR